MPGVEALRDTWARITRQDHDAPGSAPMPWAFFTLKTGVPGSGKSLTLVDELRQACESENPPTVYVHNIPNLALPHIPLPVFNPVVTQKGDDGKPMQVFSRTLEVDWSAVASGSLVVIDEAQHVFPPRGSAGRVPGYVSFLNTHRHKPVLIVLITQHPKLIDGAVRKLISKHQHYRRLFGGGRHICYEWDSCSENLAGFKEATKRVAAFPKKAFTAYKSAEAHHKPKFRLPLWMVVPLLAVAGLAWFLPDVYRIFTGEHGKQSAERAAAAAGVASAPGAPGPGQVPQSGQVVGMAPAQVALHAAAPVPMPASFTPVRYWPPRGRRLFHRGRLRMPPAVWSPGARPRADVLRHSNASDGSPPITPGSCRPDRFTRPGSARPWPGRRRLSCCKRKPGSRRARGRPAAGNGRGGGRRGAVAEWLTDAQRSPPPCRVEKSPALYRNVL